MCGSQKTFRGRPLLPQFNPPNAPSCTDLAAWSELLLNKQTHLFAAETLVEVYDTAIEMGAKNLASRFEGILWLTAEEYIALFVHRLRPNFVDPIVLINRSIDYFISALRNRFDQHGVSLKDYGHLRRGFFRFLKSRTLDARRIELRIFKKSIGATGRHAALHSLDKADRQALRGIDVERLASTEGYILSQIVLRLLTGNLTWMEIGKPLNLTAGAARKRFERFIKRWRQGRDGRDR